MTEHATTLSSAERLNGSVKEAIGKLTGDVRARRRDGVRGVRPGRSRPLGQTATTEQARFGGPSDRLAVPDVQTREENNLIDTDRITGTAKELGGKLQGTVGDLTASQRDSVEGRAREAGGKAEKLYGQAKDTVRDAAEQAVDTAQDIGGRVRDAAENLVRSDDVEGCARRTQGAAEEHFDRAQRSVRQAVGDASDYADDAYERGSRYLHRGTREVSHQVAEYPLASLLIAGAVGFGLGLLVTANRD